MKKLIILCFLLATTFTVKAQQLSFDETVNFINEKLACCSYDKHMIISAKKDGTLKFLRWSINLFDLDKDTEKQKWVYFSKSEIMIRVNDKDWTHFARFAVKSDGKQVWKAILHLRSLCAKTNALIDK